MANLGPSAIAGRKVRELRRQHRWTAFELAERCALLDPATSITATVVTNLETARRPSRQMAIEELLTFARALGVEPLSLLPLSECKACQGEPPGGFTCNTCGRSGQWPNQRA
jgi:transcriptional regulator with XRE-family HTH domain